MPPSRKIPPGEWERHKATILRLRFDENLPLKSTNTGGRSLMQVMQDDHQFYATTAQYESQILKWGAAKNLRRHEWDTILPIYNDLERRHLMPRVRVGDQILEEKKVKKARHHYGIEGGERNSNSTATLTPSQKPRWRIEFREHDGQYREYSDHPGKSNVPEDLSCSALIQRDNLNSFPEMGSEPAQISLNGAPNSASLVHTPNSQLARFSPRLSPPSTSSWNADYFDLISDIHDPLCSSDALVSDFDTTWPLNITDDALHNISQPVEPTSKSLMGISPGLIDAMLQRISLSQTLEQHKLPTAHEIFDTVVSLPQTIFRRQNCAEEPISTSFGSLSILEISQKIVYSVANNFVGLESLPPFAKMSILRLAPEIMAAVLEGLRSDNYAIAKSLADNLFSVAIKAGDERAVDSILTITSGRINEIDVNNFICNFRGINCSPINLAFCLYHSRVVQTLLSHGAKLVKPGPWRMMYETYRAGAASDARIEQELIPLVEIMLDLEPNLAIKMFMDVLLTNWQRNDLIELLFQFIPTEHYVELLNPDIWPLSYKWSGSETTNITVLQYIIKEMINKVANQTIKNFLGLCQPTKIASISTEEHSETLQLALALAISKGNDELVVYLLNLTKPTLWHLTLAIHRGKLSLAESMLDQDTCPVGKAVCLAEKHICNSLRHKIKVCDCTLTTPLAEAIRLKSSSLVNRLEQYGVLNSISDGDKSHLKAAIHATGEVGNFSYLKQLLSMAPSNHDLRCLLEPIQNALQMGEFTIALDLIQYHARKIPPHDGSVMGVLQATVRTGNLGLIKTVLDHYPWDHYDLLLSEAVKRGQKDVIEALLHRGLTLSSYAYQYTGGRRENDILSLAIAQQNAELVSLLLENGCAPQHLDEAVRLGDERILHLLLHYGANPADEVAFSDAVKGNNKSLLSSLARAFSRIYPNGKKRFGGMALATAISSRDPTALGALLKAKLDIESRARIAPLPGYKNSSRSAQIAKTFSSEYVMTNNGILAFAVEEARGGDPVLYRIIHQLLDAGADIDKIAPDDLIYRGSQTALLKAIDSNNMPVVGLLLSRGADINRPAQYGLTRTPLQQACQRGYFQMIKLLLANQADINAHPAINGGATALQLAAIQGNSNIVRLLLENGAKIDEAPAQINGRTALEGAAEHGRLSVLDILLTEGDARYKLEDIQGAIQCAEKENRRGCVERLKLARFRYVIKDAV